jgi:ubiquinol-cytochrome c reductase iron-sulfur subunit
MALEPQTVYVAPSDYHLLIEDRGWLSLSTEAPVRSARPSIDVLFETAADADGAALTGVLLTGASADGVLTADWPGGFFCPCHGSKFDLSGRVFAGVPAPTNLEIPPYAFADDQHIVIGLDQAEDA